MGCQYLQSLTPWSRMAVLRGPLQHHHPRNKQEQVRFQGPRPRVWAYPPGPPTGFTCNAAVSSITGSTLGFPDRSPKAATVLAALP